jgi:hypothetical protein
MTTNEMAPAYQKREKAETKENDNVVCKMYVKGKPNNLIEIVRNILIPLNVKTSSGYSASNTPDYNLTILIEKA